MDTYKRKSLFYLMISVVFGGSMSACISPYVMTTLLRDYNASVFQIALIPVIIQLGGFLVLPVTIVLNNFNRKKTCIFLYSFGRSFLIVFPIILMSQHADKNNLPFIFLTAYVLIRSIGTSAIGLTQTWFKEIIPQDNQAAFLGKRAALSTVIIGCLTPVIGLFMGKYSLLGLDRKSMYAILFTFAIIAGYIDMYFLTQVEESSTVPKKRFNHLFLKVKSTLKNRDNRNASILVILANIGAFIVAPFLILTYYDIGLTKFMVGIIVALSTVGTALGSIIGGHFSDKLFVRKVFLFSSFLRTFCHICFFVLTVLAFSFELPKILILSILAIISTFMMISEGCINMASIKYTYNTVKDGSSISFAFIIFIKGLITFVILSFAAKFGAFLSDKSNIFKIHLWNGFHYIQILLLVSIGLSLVCCIYLRKENLYKNVSLIGNQKTNGF